jgi:YspA, cpYpsA-related SLOG family
MTKWAIVGSREFNDYNKLKQTLDKYILPSDEIISGGANGADKLAERYANENDIKIEIFYPDWSLGKKAGPIRNSQIINACDSVIAFWDGKSRGTKDSIDKATKANKKVIQFL